MTRVRAFSLVIGVAAAGVAACASAPKTTEAQKRIARNPPAVIEGRVTDLDGRPAAGVGVRGIPRGKDIPWSAPAMTDCDGRFALRVAAPGAYAFLLSWKTTAILTPSPNDPALTAVAVEPGGRIAGVALVFDAEAWRTATGGVLSDTPTCP